MSIVATTKKSYSTEIESSSHSFWADEPESAGGQNLGPSPMEYLEAAIASCSTITMRMYADRKGWDVSEIQVSIERRNNSKTRETLLAKKVKIKGSLDQKQTQRLIEIGGRCPVIKLVSKDLKVVLED